MSDSHSNYVLFPKSQKIIDISKIKQRIENESQLQELPYFNTYRNHGELMSEFVTLVEEGVFKNIPEFKEQIETLIGNTRYKYWTIDRTMDVKGDFFTEAKRKEFVSDAEISAIAGWEAHFFFTPEEIQNYKQFGAKSISEFTGTIATFIIKEKEKEMKTFRDGKEWTSEHPNGMKYESVVKGNSNGDIIITQDDITPYRTINPLGNKVNYRPLIDMDENGVHCWNTVGKRLLMSIMRYIDYNNIESEHFNDQGEQLIEIAKQVRKEVRDMEGDIEPLDINYEHSFESYDRPFRKLNSSSILKYGSDVLPAEGERNYRICTNRKKELLIGKVNGDREFEQNLKFIPQETDKLLESLFYHIASGNSDSSINEMVGVMQYRFSEQFQKHLNN